VGEPPPPLCGRASLPRSRLHLSSCGCYGEFTTRAYTFTHARGLKPGAGGCACRRAATTGYCTIGGLLAATAQHATPRHFPPYRHLLCLRASPRAGPAAPTAPGRGQGRVRRGAGPSPPSHPPPPSRSKQRAETQDTHPGTAK
jgi:hypothetical protein